MSEKDLGEGIEKFEEEIENLKNTRMKLFGITMTPTTIGAAFAVISTIVGGMYGAFQVYTDYMGMKEIIANIDTTEIENRNKLIEQKLAAAQKEVDKAVDYSRAIKDDLRDQIATLDTNVRRVEKLMRENEQATRQIIQNAEERFDNKRDALQNQYDTKASQLRDTTDQKIKDVEDRLNSKLQKALDNPLAN
jgi:membrane-associated HD superfamily phosphohydrolase